MLPIGPDPLRSTPPTPPSLWEAAKMPKDDDDLSGFEEPPPMGVPPGGFDDDDKALKGIKRRSSTLGRVATVLLVVGGGAIGYFAYRGNVAREARWDTFNQLQNAPSIQAYLTGLRQAYPTTEYDDVKVEMLKKFGQYQDAAAVPILISALDDAGIVRRQAALSLAAIGLPAAAPAKEKLFAVLSTSDEKDKWQVIWALAVLRESRAADAIIEAFSQGFLQAQPDFDPKVITDVLGPSRLASPQLTGHANKGVRTLVAQALSEAATPEVVEPLTRMLRDRDNDVVRQAAAGLGRTGDPRAAAPLFQVLQSKPQLQASIFDAIRRTTGAPSLAALVQNASDATIKRELVRMLAATHDPRAADTLATLVNDADGDTKETAILGLAELGDPRSVPGLLEAARGTDDPSAREALGALRTLARPEMVQGLSEILTTYPGRRADCLRALGKSGSQAAGPIIEAELGGDDIETAMRAIADLRYEPAYARVLESVKRPRDVDFTHLTVAIEMPYRNRLVAINALGRWGKPEASETLMTIVEDPLDEPRLREAAGLALGLVAPPEVMTQILTKIKDAQTDPTVRLYYTQGLWQRPRRELASQLFDLFNATTPGEVRRAASLAVGYAADPANDARLVAMLDDAALRRDAAFAIVLGGSPEAADKLVRMLPTDRDVRDLLQGSMLGAENSWFDMLSPEMFDSGGAWRRIRVGEILRDGVGDDKYTFAYGKIIQVLKSGWDGPNGVSAREVRTKLVAALAGSDADLRRLAAETLGAMQERGLLIAARDSSGPGAEEARNVLRLMNRTGSE